MSFTTEQLYKLLPAVYRIRDHEIAAASGGRPLYSLLAVIAEQISILEENLEQLYDDQFIETCAPWVVPYLGELVGAGTVRPLPEITSQRALVGQSIALRRRKGTATALEEVARSSTDLPARAVEFFERLITTQYLNHLRPHNLASPDLRRVDRLGWLGTPFEATARTAEVRRIEPRRGEQNIQNVGLFLWRLRAFRRQDSPAVRVDKRRFLFSVLGAPLQLFSRPVAEAEISHLAEPHNVPLALQRLWFEHPARRPQPALEQINTSGLCDPEPPKPRWGEGRMLLRVEDFYGKDKSFFLVAGDKEIPPEQILICNLSDDRGGWAHPPKDLNSTPPKKTYAIDPELGRIYCSSDEVRDLRVMYHYGFSAAIGGGEYTRPNKKCCTQEEGGFEKITVKSADELASALQKSNTASSLEITLQGNDHFEVPAGFVNFHRLALRAAPGSHPHLAIPQKWDLRANAVNQNNQSQRGTLLIEGLLLSGGELWLTGQLEKVRICHATLVPGQGLTSTPQGNKPAGSPLQVGEPVIVLKTEETLVEIERSIVGALWVKDSSAVCAKDSILDAGSLSRHAFIDDDGYGPGGSFSAEGCTVLGAVYALRFVEISNSILWANPTVPVKAVRLQEGCVRFSYVPPNAQTPRRYRCADSSTVRPYFNSLRYGEAAYCQLSSYSDATLRRGAEDESEMGAFRHLYLPQREDNLRGLLDEYLRFSLEAGIFYAS